MTVTTNLDYKVFHLISASHRISGGEKSIFYMLEQMLLKGLDLKAVFIIDKFSGENKFLASEEAVRRKIPVLNIISEKRIDRKLFFGIEKIITENTVHILHCHGYKADIYGCLIGKRAGVKVVCTLHGWLGGSTKLRIYEKIDYYFYKFLVDKIITVSKAYENRLIKMGIAAEKIVTIPNTVDTRVMKTSVASKDLKKEFGISSSHKVVGIVARLSREKVHEVFINSCVEILKGYRNVTFLIVGEGYRLPVLKNIVAELGLEKNIIFTGYQNDIAAIYSALDIVVLSSLTEGLPVSLLEASSFEKPVVATNVGGVSEIVVNGKTGFIVPPNNSKSLADKILLLLNNDELAKRLGRNGQNFIDDKFGPESVSNKTMLIYDHVLRSQKV